MGVLQPWNLLDVNDNAPHITVTSKLGTLPESAEPGTVVALISVHPFLLWNANMTTTGPRCASRPQ